MKKGKRLVREWIKALRSGKYKQARETLCKEVIEDSNSEYRYCCVGVLGRICGFSNNNLLGVVTKRPHDTGEFHESWWKRRGLKDLGIIQEELVSFNDNEKWTFKKIANYLEKIITKGKK